ncbi:hypothetical protein BDP55DRAFT_411963 [Colletotrichum godetiae]|uniref:Uncharacterized protein n=1 Tax=Colletotrichum godetiae TaxID=1209918 RepID=A0AAJ0ASJ1_9PEZI|nr:uncharacterized protein BDP55DRAFT_411963 [Colletotrichum godetiae]KAK1689587.1 hypothetical protein BDP55DRAFT_411963 [Colletotrichum godetiae]
MCQKGWLAPKRHEKVSTIGHRRGRQAILSLSAVNAKPERQQGRADRPGQLPKCSLARIDSGGSSRLTPERCGFMETSFDRSEVRTNRARYWKGKIPRTASPRKKTHRTRQEKLSFQAFLAESDSEGKENSFSIATSAPGGCLVTSTMTGSETAQHPDLTTIEIIFQSHTPDHYDAGSKRFSRSRNRRVADDNFELLSDGSTALLDLDRQPATIANPLA